MKALFTRFHEFFEESGSKKLSTARLNAFMATCVALYLVILDSLSQTTHVNVEFVITLLSFAFGTKFAQKFKETK